MLQPCGTIVCDIRGPCYGPMAHMCMTLFHRNSYISIMLLEVCKASGTEGFVGLGGSLGS